ncbi:hypothetical protein H4219_001865 [Mycoemilia scoparia]|uniref:Uncharacterized protein n=1 Tax=Mycoemilia scoparia TaxID=417184 RepID=A0A9W8A2K0_9FUNG|nr:hypothetical protein H4219_001865 [Mycoemilia scoparia]
MDLEKLYELCEQFGGEAFDIDLESEPLLPATDAESDDFQENRQKRNRRAKPNQPPAERAMHLITGLIIYAMTTVFVVFAVSYIAKVDPNIWYQHELHNAQGSSFQRIPNDVTGHPVQVPAEIVTRIVESGERIHMGAKGGTWEPLLKKDGDNKERFIPFMTEKSEEDFLSMVAKNNTDLVYVPEKRNDVSRVYRLIRRIGHFLLGLHHKQREGQTSTGFSMVPNAKVFAILNAAK